MPVCASMSLNEPTANPASCLCLGMEEELSYTALLNGGGLGLSQSLQPLTALQKPLSISERNSEFTAGEKEIYSSTDCLRSRVLGMLTL